MKRSYSRNGNERRERATVLGLLGFCVLILLLGRLFQLQVLGSERSLELARRNWLRPEYLPGPRGCILDRSGRVLADARPSFSIVVDPDYDRFLRRPDALDSSLVALAGLLSGDVERYRRDVRRGREATYKAIRLERNADSVCVATVEEHRARLPGISVEVEAARFYPEDSLACHVLGYVSEVSGEDLERLEGKGYRPGSMIGQTGVEKQFEDLLRGEDGIRYVEVNALGRRSEAFLRTEPVFPNPGRDLVLSLDSRLQREAEWALDDAPYDGEGDPIAVRGAVVLMNVWTGEVLALASRPAFDGNLFAGGVSQEDWESIMGPDKPQLNRVVHAAYPPGSVIKPFSAYAGLVDGCIGRIRFTPCYGGFKFGNAVKRCWKRGGHGRLDVLGAIAQSCDVYFYQVGAAMGVEGIARYAKDVFALDALTGIDLPLERRGKIPDTAFYDERFGERGWTRGVALNLIIGQGEMLLTPIELVQHAGVLATGGRRVTPRLLLDLGEERREGRYPEPPLGPSFSETLLDPEALALAKQGMVDAVAVGTAGGGAVEGVVVAGKTGTAENPGQDHALFIGYAPADAPEVAVAVVLENRGHGGAAAAPVAGRILSAYFATQDSTGARSDRSELTAPEGRDR